MMKIKTLIIDDEFLNRDLISKLIQKMDINFEIVADAENIDDAYDLIQKHNPDLIFLDIKMPGGNGFELLQRFVKPTFEVVFITGFDEYALQAFEFNALDYILKPIDTDKLKKTLEKVRGRISSKLSLINNLNEIISIYNTENQLISKIPVHHNDKVVLINMVDIISIEADQGYTVFKVMGDEEYISAKQFFSFEFIFEKHSFFIKINKGVYINMNFLKNYSKREPCFVELVNNQSFEISRRKKTEILAILDRERVK